MKVLLCRLILHLLKRSISLAAVCILLTLDADSQHKSFTDYYFEAKAIADSLKTYEILIEARDTTFPFRSNEYVKNEVGKTFNFLHTKKRVHTDPDFVIKIIVSDVAADVDYAYMGKNLDQDVYEMKLSYDVSFALSFEAIGKTSVYIPICTKKHYTKKYKYNLQNTDFNNSSNHNPIKTGDQKMPVHKYAERLETSLDKSVFIYEFNEELVRFRKKQK